MKLRALVRHHALTGSAGLIAVSTYDRSALA